MTKYELGKILQDMYNSAKNGEKVAMIHLFGMKYGNKLKEVSSFREIAEIAGIQESYSTEISKGSKISDVSKSLNFTTLSSSDYIFKNNKIKNIILYGAPGVGKTHNTQKLISLVESGVDEKEIFQMIEENLLNDGIEANQVLINIENRVRFITL